MRKLIKQMKKNHSFIEKWFFTGEFDKALEYIEREEELIKDFQGDLPEEIKLLHTSWLFHRAIIYAYRGNLAFSFKDAKELLRVAQLYDQKRGISDGSLELGRYYWFSGDLDNALVHMDRAIKLSEDGAVNDFRGFVRMTVQLMSAAYVSIEKEDLKRAKKYFKRLEDIRELKYKEEHFYIKNTYQLVKGRLLQSTMRSRDRVIAEDLFREIIEDDRSFFVYKLEAIHDLCELFLIELRISNDIKIIGEIKPLLEKLIGMAQKSGLNYYLIEAYILHGKLALVMFDIENSRRYLTQARRMAERFGYIILADEIKGLYEAMMVKIDTWEQMEKKNAPISERMELAKLNDHLKGRFRLRVMKMEQVTDGEVTVYKGSQICLVCKGSAGGFNFYICPMCNSVYCKECTQAVIDLENQCWSCNSPIDISKPVKPYKPEIVGEGTSKKTNKY